MPNFDSITWVEQNPKKDGDAMKVPCYLFIQKKKEESENKQRDSAIELINDYWFILCYILYSESEALIICVGIIIPRNICNKNTGSISKNLSCV